MHFLGTPCGKCKLKATAAVPFDALPHHYGRFQMNSRVENVNSVHRNYTDR